MRGRQGAAALLLLALAFWGCGGGPPAEGRYREEGAAGTAGGVVLELHGGGRGSWTVQGESVPLRWERRRSGEVWLHFKSGGVLVARPPAGAEAGFAVELPGVGTVRLAPESP